MLIESTRNDLRRALLARGNFETPDGIIDAIEGWGFAIVSKRDLAALYHLAQAIKIVGNANADTMSKAEEAAKR